MKQQNKVLGINEKLAASGCALSAIYLLPAAGALAVPVENTGSITFNLGDSPVYWDVDGNGSDEYILTDLGGGAGFLDSNDYSNGSATLGARGMVQVPPATSSDLFSPLSPGFSVGASLATGYVWGSSPQGARTIVSSGGTQVGFDASYGGFVSGGDQYFGFRFDRAGQTHYGWAEINIDTSGAPGGFTIVRWGYEDQPDTPIAVESAAPPAPGEAKAIPVNGLPFIGLTLLGLGAAGVRELRRKRKVDSELH